jgi:hypothetical protein
MNDEPDFALNDFNLTPVQQGVTEFTVKVQNNGTGIATSGVVPIAWEKFHYELPLTNGIGTLAESVVDLDLSGDGDKTDAFTITWFHNDTRQWDATIDDGVKEIHAYSLWEGPVEKPWSNQTHLINGQSKLFQLGTETHSLYFANNTVVILGLIDARIENHPSPCFVLELDSSITAIDFTIKVNDDDPRPVNVNYTSTREGLIGGNQRNSTLYIIADQAMVIDTEMEVEFSVTLIARENKTAFTGFALNWSPDNENRKYSWVLVEAEVPVEEVIYPYFSVVNPSVTIGDNNVQHLTATIKNYGGIATKGNVVTLWEEYDHVLMLSGGVGNLAESDVDLDINGDGDSVDNFEVRYSPSETREMDATVDGVYAYSYLEVIEGGGGAYSVISSYINGESKLFKLGNNEHILYEADEYHADIGLNAKIVNLTGPFIQPLIWLYNLSDRDFVNVSGFKINEKHVELSYNSSLIVNYTGWGLLCFDLKIYNFPADPSDIAPGEEITVSFTLEASKNITCMVSLLVNWSPDSITRYRTPMFGKSFFWPSIILEPKLTTTTSSTNGAMGFSFITLLALILPVVFLMHKRRYD